MSSGKADCGDKPPLAPSSEARKPKSTPTVAFSGVEPVDMLGSSLSNNNDSLSPVQEGTQIAAARKKTPVATPTGKRKSTSNNTPASSRNTTPSKKARTPASSAKATNKKASTNKSKSSSKKKSAFGTITTPIDPVFAMFPRNWFNPAKILEIHSELNAGDWHFELMKYVSKIVSNHPYLDFYVVGYRSEEKTLIRSIDSCKQIHVPYFAVHGVPKGSPPPNDVVIPDLELKTKEFQSLKNLPLEWSYLGSFPDGQKVNMLVSTARTTSRALATPTGETQVRQCSGAQFWFSTQIDDNANPGDAFRYDHDGDEFFFTAEDAWYNTRVKLKKSLKEEGVPWADFCGWEEKRWLARLLPTAVDEFFEYEDDLPRNECESEVRKLLSSAFCSFKRNREATVLNNKENHEVAERAKHFKIYPENDCLHEYISSRDVAQLHQWCSKPEDVYPHIQKTPSSANEPIVDLWGVPLDG
jgi:hypothetical protein